jgi:hypothetical protein
MRSKGFFTDDRAVSETVGFIIIFGIVITGIGLVTLYGYPVLLNQQAEANIRNMQKNMIVLQSDVNSLTYKNVPYQETTLQVSGGTLMVENPSDEKYFDIYNYTYNFTPENFKPGQLLFISDSEPVRIGLQNGAVVKWQLGGSVMLSEPRWFLDEDTDTLVITLIQIDSDTNMAQTGIGTVSMNIDQVNYREYIRPDDTVTIEYTDPPHDYFTAWRNYFRNEFSSTSSDAKVSIPDVDKLIIKTYNVTVLSL